MSCTKCSDEAPNFPDAGEEYICSFCRQRWRLTNEAPGAYWEPIEVYISEKAFSEKIKSEFFEEREKK